MKNNYLKMIFVLFFGLFLIEKTFAFEKSITIPAEKEEGVVVELGKGQYLAEIEGGAIALVYPVSPNYRWLIGIAIGTNAQGGQDEPNMGTLYFEPDPPVFTQAEAEQQALKAVKEKVTGTCLKFSLEKDEAVRFWVSDFDYTDNSGMVKLKIQKINQKTR